MKNFYSLLLLSLISITSQAQIWDSPFIVDSIDFESASPYLQLDTSATNLWQIAPPTKPVLNSPVSPTHVIITDSLQPYPVSNHSFFDILVTQQTTLQFPELIIVKFKHKICSDSLKDGGYITYSCDMGANWQNVIDYPSCSYWDWYPGDGDWEDYRNLYSSTDTLYNGEQGFSGCMDDWEEVILDWGYWPIQPPPGQDIMDTILIRFNFISDTINSPYDGWMIDDIQFLHATMPSSTNNQEKAHFKLYPNPTISRVNIELDNYYPDLKLKLINSVGQIVLQKPYAGTEKISLFIQQNLPDGIYFMEILSDETSLGKRKLIIRN